MPKFYCFNCSQHIDADESLAGTMAACPSCHTKLYVPGDIDTTTVILAVAPYTPLNSCHDYPKAEALQVRDYGGIRRLPYLGIIFGLAVVQGVLISSAGTAFPSERVALLVVSAGTLITVFYRLKNIGMNPWWCLLMFVPIANLFLVVRSLVFQEGYQDMKKLDKTGRIITYILVGFIVLCVLSVIVMTITSK